MAGSQWILVGSGWDTSRMVCWGHLDPLKLPPGPPWGSEMPQNRQPWNFASTFRWSEFMNESVSSRHFRICQRGWAGQPWAHKPKPLTSIGWPRGQPIEVRGLGLWAQGWPAHPLWQILKWRDETDSFMNSDHRKVEAKFQGCLFWGISDPHGGPGGNFSGSKWPQQTILDVSHPDPTKIH